MQWLKNIDKKYYVIAGFLIVGLIFFHFVLPISIPLILAFVTALVLGYAVNVLTKNLKLKRPIAVAIIFVLYLAAITYLLVFTATKTTTQVISFVENVPTYTVQLKDGYDKIATEVKRYSEDVPPEFVTQVATSIEGTITEFIQAITEKFSLENIARIFSGVPNFLVSSIVYAIALFLFMMEMPKIRENVSSVLSDSTKKNIKFFNDKVTGVVFGFFKMQFQISIIIFIVTFIGLLWIEPDTAFMMALIIWVVDLIPIIGSIVVLAPWSIFMYFSGDVETSIQLAILAAILLLIRRTVEPKLMGDNIGLSPLATLISMYIGYQIVGLIGFIIGPLVVVFYTTAKEAGFLKLKSKI